MTVKQKLPSEFRRRESSRVLKDPDGNVVCSCGCGRRPPKGRRYWFSQECVDQWKSRHDPQYQRVQLLKRDHGVCNACGRDMERAMRRMGDRFVLLRRYDPSERFWRAQARCGEAQAHVFLRSLMKSWPALKQRLERLRKDRIHRMLLDQYPVHISVSWWQADHILPVAQGGARSGIDELQTLCHGCHTLKTKLDNERTRASRAASAHAARDRGDLA